MRLCGKIPEVASYQVLAAGPWRVYLNKFIVMNRLLAEWRLLQRKCASLLHKISDVYIRRPMHRIHVSETNTLILSASLTNLRNHTNILLIVAASGPRVSLL